MLIGKDYKIESDKLNVVLSQKKTSTRKSSGEEYSRWKVLGYFATVENALNELVNQGIRDTELKDFQFIVKEVKSLRSAIGDALRKR